MIRLRGRRIGLLVGLLLVAIAAGVAFAFRPDPAEEAAVIWITPLQELESESTPAFVVAQTPTGETVTVRRAQPQPPPPRPWFPRHQIVIYYGNPLSARMGILGEHPPEEVVRRVKATAQRYQEVNPDKTVIAALDLVYAVAQEGAGRDGKYLLRMDDELVEQYIELTRREGMLFFLDIQNGRADPLDEVRNVLRWMKHDHVHLAVDPEFTMPPGKLPGIHFGTLDGHIINQIQDMLEQTALENGISNKIMLVYQFVTEMLSNKTAIEPRERVDFVLIMDGFGSPAAKLSKYDLYVRDQPVEFGGIKLFYRQDRPVMSVEEISALTPRPDVIQYQ
jgi:hypothetical protein